MAVQSNQLNAPGARSLASRSSGQRIKDAKDNLVLLLNPIYEDEQRLDVQVSMRFVQACQQHPDSEVAIPLSNQHLSCLLKLPATQFTTLSPSGTLTISIQLMPEAWRYLMNQRYRLVDGLKTNDFYEIFCVSLPEPPVSNWPDDYFASVVGGWVGEPLERGEQGGYPDRLGLD